MVSLNNLIDRVASLISSLLVLQTSIKGGVTSTKSSSTPATIKVTTTSSPVRVTTTSSPAAAAATSSVRSTVPSTSVRPPSSSSQPLSSQSTSSSRPAALLSVSVPSSVVLPPSVSSLLSGVTTDLPTIDAIPTISEQLPSSIAPVSIPSVSLPPANATASELPKAEAQYIIINRILILADSNATALTSEIPLDGYGIPWDTFVVPKEGIKLPVLNTTNENGKTVCNYNGIAIHGRVSYDYGPTTRADGTVQASTWASAITQAQWDELNAYQTLCDIRVVHFNNYPDAQRYGVVPHPNGGCCASSDHYQNATIIANVEAERFPQAGLKSATISLKGLWHVPAVLVEQNKTKITPFLQFEPSNLYAEATIGGVIATDPDNGRSEMVFFLTFGTWSPASAFLNHAWIQWITHGVYPGFRRVYFSTQIDDILLDTAAWDTGDIYRTSVKDMVVHADWVDEVNARLAKTNPGSHYVIELGYNGNGNLLTSNVLNPTWSICTKAPIWYRNNPERGPYEWKKQIGTGENSWPDDAGLFTQYPLPCLNLDPLSVWLGTAAKADSAYAYVSHTFTHLALNNATYNDTMKELGWNILWAKTMLIDKHSMYSPGGLIPPAITGMNNGDALQAMKENKIWNAVGDNTRPALRNQQSVYWPYITTVANNGFDGFFITPRWATRIYFNCDTVACDVKEWVTTSGISEALGIYDLLEVEKVTTMNSLLSLMHDGYMFHQANMRTEGINDTYTIPGSSLRGKYSLLQLWTETQITEFQRLVDWPLITAKHDDVAAAFRDRYYRDECNMEVEDEIANGKIVGITIGTVKNNKCDVEIPVTVVGGIKETGSHLRVEKVGNDPHTIWVKMTGQVVHITPKTPISITGL